MRLSHVSLTYIYYVGNESDSGCLIPIMIYIKISYAYGMVQQVWAHSKLTVAFATDTTVNYIITFPFPLAIRVLSTVWAVFICRPIHFLLPSIKSSGYSLRAKGHPYQLPRCEYKLHKKSFIPRCLYRNCNCWTVSFLIVCFYVCLSLCVFMSLFYYARFFLFFSRMLIHCHVQFVACTFVTCFNKNQSINQNIV